MNIVWVELKCRQYSADVLSVNSILLILKCQQYSADIEVSTVFC